MKRYFDRIQSGQPIDDVEIIDFHAHLGPFINMHLPWNDADAVVHMMDLCGIDKTIVSPTPGLSSDLVYGNDMMIDAIKSHRGRLYGACYANGHYPGLSVDELERCFAEEKHVVLIKIHPIIASCRMDDRRMKGIYEFASKRKLFIIVHTWLDNDNYGGPDIFASVVKEYPDINWLMGHSGGDFGSYRAVEIAQEFPNVFLDLTLSYCVAQQVEFFVKEIGADRIIFGTDNPFLDPRPQIGKLFLAGIPQEDKVKIAGENAKRYINFN